MKFEVWNCGVHGYGVNQYYQAMLEKVPAANPDLVIAGFCLNDFCELPVVMRDRRGLTTPSATCASAGGSGRQTGLYFSLRMPTVFWPARCGTMPCADTGRSAVSALTTWRG